MKKIVLLLFMLVIALGCDCNASELDKDCYQLDKLMVGGNPSMKGAMTCKYLENFCTFTSEQKALGEGEMTYTYTQQIPCEQYETYKAIHDCTLEYQKVCPDSKRYTLTRECIISKTDLIKK